MKTKATFLIIFTMLTVDLYAAIGIRVPPDHSTKKNINSCQKSTAISQQNILVQRKTLHQDTLAAKNFMFRHQLLTLAATDDETKQSENIIITDEEIKKAMKFGAKEKISSIVFGALLGAYICGSIGALVANNNDEIGYALVGMGAGFITGPFINYYIIKSLAKKEAREKILESRKQQNSQGCFQIGVQFSINK